MILLSILVLVRSYGALYAPIMDCDETFNYWEPLHYLMYGSGLQTWEYSPEFALRTYGYIGLHGLFGLVPWIMYPSDKVLVFYCIRGVLGLICAYGEYLFCQAIQKRYGKETADTTMIFLMFNSGMFHSSVSFLPSSTCMIAVIYGYYFWMQERHISALYCGAFAVLLCWPFVALMFIPIGLYALYEKGFVKVFVCAMISVLLFAAAPSILDTYLYGKPVWPIMNLILYNVLGQGGDGQGANLYGTEPWHFYFKNLLLNVNIILPLSMIPSAEKYLFPAFLSFALFTSMPHKEERFLSMIYPVMCFGASLTLNRFPFAFFRKLVLLGFVVISMSRTAALVLNYQAPQVIYSQLPQQSYVLCVEKEWYRFPSSFFLPESVKLGWIQSSFGGLLPQPFSEWPNGTSVVHSHFNDKNQLDSAAYVPVQDCDKLIDYQITLEGWKKQICHPFLDTNASPPFKRSFYIPIYSLKTNQYSDYCLYDKLDKK